jgi:hypothetical protein
MHALLTICLQHMLAAHVYMSCNFSCAILQFPVSSCSWVTTCSRLNLNVMKASPQTGLGFTCRDDKAERKRDIVPE